MGRRPELQGAPCLKIPPGDMKGYIQKNDKRTPESHAFCAGIDCFRGIHIICSSCWGAPYAKEMPWSYFGYIYLAFPSCRGESPSGPTLFRSIRKKDCASHCYHHETLDGLQVLRTSLTLSRESSQLECPSKGIPIFIKNLGKMRDSANGLTIQI